jgi:acylphosphatase
MSPTSPQRRVVHYRGMVQGVGFRYTTQRIAGRFRVTGYVQNLSDGRVLVAVEGEPDELDRFLAAIAEHLGHYVDQVTARVEPPENAYRGFDIRF